MQWRIKDTNTRPTASPDARAQARPLSSIDARVVWARLDLEPAQASTLP
jgi:hypothetical protein